METKTFKTAGAARRALNQVLKSDVIGYRISKTGCSVMPFEHDGAWTIEAFGGAGILDALELTKEIQEVTHMTHNHTETDIYEHDAVRCEEV